MSDAGPRERQQERDHALQLQLRNTRRIFFPLELRERHRPFCWTVHCAFLRARVLELP